MTTRFYSIHCEIKYSIVHTLEAAFLLRSITIRSADQSNDYLTDQPIKSSTHYACNWYLNGAFTVAWLSYSFMRLVSMGA